MTDPAEREQALLTDAEIIGHLENHLSGCTVCERICNQARLANRKPDATADGRAGDTPRTDALIALLAADKLPKVSDKAFHEADNGMDHFDPDVAASLIDLCRQLETALLAQSPAARGGGEWIAVDGMRNVPIGTWLVFLEEPMLNSRIHTATAHKNVRHVGGCFDFDAPKVVAYAELPDAPRTARAQSVTQGGEKG